MRPNTNARRYLAGSHFRDAETVPATSTCAAVVQDVNTLAHDIRSLWQFEATGKVSPAVLVSVEQPIKVQLPVNLREKQRRSRRQVAAIMHSSKLKVIRDAHAEDVALYSKLAAGNLSDEEFAHALGMNITAAHEWCRALESTFLRFCEDKPSTMNPGDAVNMEPSGKDILTDVLQAKATGENIHISVDPDDPERPPKNPFDKWSTTIDTHTSASDED